MDKVEELYQKYKADFLIKYRQKRETIVHQYCDTSTFSQGMKAKKIAYQWVVDYIDSQNKKFDRVTRRMGYFSKLAWRKHLNIIKDNIEHAIEFSFADACHQYSHYDRFCGVLYVFVACKKKIIY
jgi:hypothetical protein